ncbi:MAG: hypothetical protein R3C02_26835 [Planctomycetaceae bacterium]
MRRTIILLLCLAAIDVTTILMAQDAPDARFQDPQPAPPTYDPGPAPADIEPIPIRGTNERSPDLLEYQIRQRLNEEAKLQQRITEATSKLTSDDGDEMKLAHKELQEAVTELFEHRAETRLKQIEELEQRIAKLREQMERREEKKSEIIQLQVQTYINQANGLGF